MYRGPAERTCLVGREPGVDALGVERVTAQRKQPDAITGLELRQTYGAVSAVSKVSGDGIEGEERQGVDGTVIAP